MKKTKKVQKTPARAKKSKVIATPVPVAVVPDGPALELRAPEPAKRGAAPVQSSLLGVPSPAL